MIKRKEYSKGMVKLSFWFAEFRKVVGDLSIGGTIKKVDELANTLQVCLDSGTKKVLLPITSAVDLGTVPSDLIGGFNIIFYQTAEDAVLKALGVE